MNCCFLLDKVIFKGGHGEIWRGYRVNESDATSAAPDAQELILKRMHFKTQEGILHCAKREAYFGQLTRGMKRVPRFIESFEFDNAMWLVFAYEGISLDQLLYVWEQQDITSFGQFRSPLWNNIRRSQDGPEILRGLMHEVIAGIADLHALGILHRDIKPSNILLRSSSQSQAVTLLMADFSSAVNSEAIALGLYADEAPSIREATLSYAPPEVMLALEWNASIQGPSSSSAYDSEHMFGYDSWSVGVLFLEMILGTSDVFSVDKRTYSLIRQRMQHENEVEVRKALFTSALGEYCVMDVRESTVGTRPVPPVEGKRDGNAEALLRSRRMAAHIMDRFRWHSNRCDEPAQAMAEAIRKRDPLRIGFKDRWGLDLLTRLLVFESGQRISMDDALNHAYFVGPFTSSLDGSEHATLLDRVMHDRRTLRAKETAAVVVDGWEEANLPELYQAHVPSDPVAWSSQNIAERSVAVAESAPRAVVPYRLYRHLLNHVESLRSDEDVTTALCRLGACDDPAELVLPPPPPLLPEERETARLSDAWVADTGFADEAWDVFCPHCGRRFRNYHTCLTHARARQHATHCLINVSSAHSLSPESGNTSPLLPQCLSERASMFVDHHSGWCDLQGRRKYMEDTTAVGFSSRFNYTLYGVFDGHYGDAAAAFASTHLIDYLDACLQEQESDWEPHKPMAIRLAIQEAFERTDRRFKELFPAAASGTTASVAVFFPRVESGEKETARNRTAPFAFADSSHVFVANVGDSAGVLCCDAEGLPVVLTETHTARNPSEARRVLRAGGWITGDPSNPEEVLRINGQLAVSRSIGDNWLRDIVLPAPHVTVVDLVQETIQPDQPREDSPLSEDASWERQRAKQRCLEYKDWRLSYAHSSHPTSPPNFNFIILASDGLWDVVSIFTAVEIVCDYFQTVLSHPWQPLDALGDSQTTGAVSTEVWSVEHMYHNAAKLLAQEAYVRGSTDNIGVCIVDIV